jgi:hypothetical protein
MLLTAGVLLLLLLLLGLLCVLLLAVCSCWSRPLL